VAQAVADTEPGASAVTAPVAASIVAVVVPAGSDHFTVYGVPGLAETAAVTLVIDPTSAISAEEVTRTLLIGGPGSSGSSCGSTGDSLPQAILAAVQASRSEVWMRPFIVISIGGLIA